MFCAAPVGRKAGGEDETAVSGWDGEVLPNDETASKRRLYRLPVVVGARTRLKVLRGVGVVVGVWRVRGAEGEGEEGE